MSTCDRLHSAVAARRRRVDAFVACLRCGDGAAAAAVLEQALSAGHPAPDLIADVVAPAMHAIGRLWEADQITVAEEHLATVACDRALLALYPSLLVERPRCRERILVVTPEGERHLLAPVAVADVLDGRGYDVVRQPAGSSAAEIAAAVERHAPALLLASVTLPLHLPALARTIATVQAVDPGIGILLGGQGLVGAWAGRGLPVGGSAADVTAHVEALLRERPPMPRVRAVAPLAPALPPQPAAAGTVADVANVAAQVGQLARASVLREHEFRLLAREDPVTGLPNRRAFEESLAAADAAGEPPTLLVVDIDRFKEVNDSFGHRAGDEALRLVAGAISRQLRTGDVVARIGGDEFGVLLRGASREDARAVAERIRAGVEAIGAARGLTVSIGGARTADDISAALGSADRRLLLAKADGRNRVVFAGAGACHSV